MHCTRGSSHREQKQRTVQGCWCSSDVEEHPRLFFHVVLVPLQGLDWNWSWRNRELFKRNWQAGEVETNVVRRAKNSDMPLLRLVPFWSTLHQFTQHLSSFSPGYVCKPKTFQMSHHATHRTTASASLTPLWRTPAGTERHEQKSPSSWKVLYHLVVRCVPPSPLLKNPSQHPHCKPQTRPHFSILHTRHTPSSHKGRKCHWASSLCVFFAKLAMTTRSEAPYCHMAEHGLSWRDQPQGTAQWGGTGAEQCKDAGVHSWRLKSPPPRTYDTNTWQPQQQPPMQPRQGVAVSGRRQWQEQEGYGSSKRSTFWAWRIGALLLLDISHWTCQYVIQPLSTTLTVICWMTCWRLFLLGL